MATIYEVILTQGNSEGTYTIYYGGVSPSNIANLPYNGGVLAQNLSLSSLLSGVLVEVPDDTTTLIVYPSVCENPLILTIENDPQPITPPNLCVQFKFGKDFFSEIFTPSPTLYNGEFQWVYDIYTISWNPTANNGQGRWELVYSPTLMFASDYTSTNGIPNGSWYSISQDQTYPIFVTENECLQPNYITVDLDSTPTSCFASLDGSQLCDGSITVFANGGTAPYTYVIDGGAPQGWATFNGLCPGEHTVTTIDAQGVTSTNTTTVGQGTQPTNINFDFTETTTTLSSSSNYIKRVNNWTIDTSQIPAGVVINLVLSIRRNKSFYAPGSGSITGNLSVYKDNVLLTPDTNNTTVSVTPRAICGDKFNLTTEFYSFLYEIQVSNGTVINGSFTSELQINSFSIDNASCFTELKDEINKKITVKNLTCNCCNAVGDTAESFTTNLVGVDNSL